MGGETESQVSPWTVDSLHIHLQMQIDALEKHHEADIVQVRRETAQALAEKDKQSDKLERQMEKRFESINEFRAQLADQVKTFISRETYDAFHKALDDRVGVVERQAFGTSEHERGGKDRVTEIRMLVGFVVGVVGTLIAAGVFR